jgi:hypothetical protein
MYIAISKSFMKQLTTIALLLCSIGVWGQTKLTKADSDTIFRIRNSLSLADTSGHFKPLNTYTSNWAYTYYNESQKYPDTVKCLFHEWRDDILLDKWTSGYIVLINGFIKAGHVSWSPYYAPMALGFFDNVFLYDNKHPIKNKVLQVIIAQ